MYIRKLSIISNHPVKEVIREIFFKMGMNLILDNSEKSGNNVGKTTTLKLIDICLGAKERKYVYFDADTKNENITLKNYIIDNKISCELILSNTFDANENKVKITVDLFPKGKRYINNEAQNQTDFDDKLNQLIFNISSKPPSFRQLIRKFVRINQKSDDNKFLKYIDFNIRNDVYVSLYNFLFKLIDTDINSQKTKMENELHELNKSLNSFKSLNQIKNIDSIIQELNAIETSIVTSNEQLLALTNSEHFKHTEKEISVIKVEYTILKDRLEQLEYEKERISNIIKNSKGDSRLVDQSILKTLYSETEIFMDLSKDFNDLVNFNEQLTKNKFDFYINELEKKNQTIQRCKEKLNELFSKNKEIIMLIKENNIEEYNKLQLILSNLTEKKGELKKVIELYLSLENKIIFIKKLVDEIEVNKGDMSNQITKFNSYFTKYSQLVAGESYFAYLNDDGFPLSIKNAGTGLGTGSKKAIISIFDLAYASFSKEMAIQSPRFIVLDVIESMESESLEKIVEIVNSIDCQYIVAVLNEKIKGNNKITENDKILELSKDDKLFKI